MSLAGGGKPTVRCTRPGSLPIRNANSSSGGGHLLCRIHSSAFEACRLECVLSAFELSPDLEGALILVVAEGEKVR